MLIIELFNTKCYIIADTLMTASVQDAEVAPQQDGKGCESMRGCDILKAEHRPLTAASKSSLQQVSL